MQSRVLSGSARTQVELSVKQASVLSSSANCSQDTVHNVTCIGGERRGNEAGMWATYIWIISHAAYVYLQDLLEPDLLHNIFIW